MSIVHYSTLLTSATFLSDPSATSVILQLGYIFRLIHRPRKSVLSLQTERLFNFKFSLSQKGGWNSSKRFI